MTRTNKLLTAVITSAVVAVGVPMVALANDGSSNHHGHAKVIHVVEHAVSDTVQQFNAPADSVGDVLAFHNPVFNANDTEQIATDNGYCIHTVVTGRTEWECNWTTMLAGGNITVEGEFFDDGSDSTLAITGGTGRYAGAGGSMLLHATGDPVGSEFDFIFTLTN
jgi:allene oxide cyclase